MNSTLSGASTMIRQLLVVIAYAYLLAGIPIGCFA
jgi:hypothetical protein